MSELRRLVDLHIFQAWFHAHFASETDESLANRANELRKLVLESSDPFHRLVVEQLAPGGRRSKDREGRDLVRGIQMALENEKWQQDFEQQRMRGDLTQGAIGTLVHNLVMRLIYFSPQAKKKLRLLPKMNSENLYEELATAKALVAGRLTPMLMQYEQDADKLAREALEALGCTNKEAHNIIRG